MALFVDTSALYALLDADDTRHERARHLWVDLSRRREQLLTSNYVLVATLALVGKRLGLQAVRDLHNDLVPVLHPIWVDENLHQRAVAALVAAGLRDLSVVDCVSFEVMRQFEVDTAFAFDAHFVREGFVCLA